MVIACAMVGIPVDPMSLWQSTDRSFELWLEAIVEKADRMGVRRGS